jgi:hypothetical protein
VPGLALFALGYDAGALMPALDFPLPDAACPDFADPPPAAASTDRQP